MSFPDYDIPVPSDLPNGVDTAQLHQEIAALRISGYKGIAVLEDTCTVLFSPTPSVADQLRVDAAVASHDPLPTYKRDKHEQFDEDTRIYLYREYSPERQRSLLDLRVEAIDQGYPNRKAYIDQFRSWLYTVIMYHKGVVEPLINAATTKADLDAVTWDLSQFDTQRPNPRVEIHVAASITS